MSTLADVLYSYIIPGHAKDARLAITQAQEAERIGLGGVFLSERWESKELGTVIGALTQVTNRVKLVAGLTHFGTRHLIVLAGMGSTMQTLSDGRFVLGFGRGVPAQFKQLGIPTPNIAEMADRADILRKLWAGETVSYEGKAGTYPALQLAHGCPNPPPLILGAIGPKTLALAGSHFDGIVLHPLLTTEGVKKSTTIVKEAAIAAGRDPSDVKVYSTIVTAPDTLPEDAREDILGARAVSYFMHPELGRQLVGINGWDPEPLSKLAETGLAKLDYGTSDINEKRRLMAEAAAMLPQAWLAKGTVSGSVERCCERFTEYLDAGVDRILIHGTTPEYQEDLVQAAKTVQL